MGSLSETKVKHFRGFPPEANSEIDLREQMESPAYLSIEEKPDGVFLFRFTAKGEVVGDTWHMTVVEAQQQAGFEFPNILSDWKSVLS